MVLVQKTASATFFPQELIGKEIEVINSRNKTEAGIRGKVVDETKSTLKIEQQKGQVKTLLKANLTLKLLESGQLIAGRNLLKRPEERIKN